MDGMEIEMQELPFPPFEISKKYLLILALDPAKQAGALDVGPSGALLVQSDDTLQPAVKNRTHFKREFVYRYGASVSKLREMRRQTLSLSGSHTQTTN